MMILGHEITHSPTKILGHEITHSPTATPVATSILAKMFSIGKSTVYINTTDIAGREARKEYNRIQRAKGGTGSAGWLRNTKFAPWATRSRGKVYDGLAGWKMQAPMLNAIRGTPAEGTGRGLWNPSYEGPTKSDQSAPYLQPALGGWAGTLTQAQGSVRSGNASRSVESKGLGSPGDGFSQEVYSTRETRVSGGGQPFAALRQHSKDARLPAEMKNMFREAEEMQGMVRRNTARLLG